MFEISMKTNSDNLKQELFDLLQEVVVSIAEEHKREQNLPYMLSKAQLAEHIFNVSPQTLDAHVINRLDFPKFKAGERLLFPRDMVLEWIRKNISEVQNLKV